MLQTTVSPVGKQPVPMPGRLPLVGHLPRLARRPLEFFQAVQAEGDVVTIGVGPIRTYVLTRPELLQAMLVRNAKEFDKGVHMEKAAHVIGNSLPVSSGAFYRRQRKMIRPAFQQAKLREYFDIMLDTTMACVENWSPATNIHQEIRRLAGAIAARTLFSALRPEQAATEAVELIDVISSLLTRRILDPTGLVERLPLPSNRRFDRVQGRFRSLAESFIRDYRRDGVDRHDLLWMLLAARDDGSGAGMSNQQVRDEATGFLAAGVEATSQALRWTVRVLAEHPRVLRTVHDEVDRVLSGRLVTFEDLDELDLTRRVLLESMRLYPPIYIGSRRPTVDIQLGDYRLPAGCMILFCPYALHRDPNLYPDPERFDPDRWLPGAAEARPPCSYLPFGAGLRSCIGEHFAMIEMLTVLSTVLQRWTLDTPASVEVRPKVASFILSPERERGETRTAVTSSDGPRLNRPGKTRLFFARSGD